MPKLREKKPGRRLEHGAARHFRSLLREARLRVLADAEGSDEVIRAIEALGAFVAKKPNASLGGVQDALVELGSTSATCDVQSFRQLFDVFREARNDRMHEGSAARRLADHAVAIVLVLEDALAEEGKLRVVQHEAALHRRA